MSGASTSYWPGPSGQSAHNSEGHRIHHSSSQQQPQQGPYMSSSSAYQMHAQYGVRQHELQLENFHDQGGIDGFSALSFGTLQPQSASQSGPVLGVGQGPGNAEPQYTAATATALAAHAGQSNDFRFGQGNAGTSQRSETSPDPSSSGSRGFSSTFSFVSPSSSAQAALTEGVSPHETFQAHPSLQNGQDFLDPIGYTPHQKRRREDTGLDTFPSNETAGSGDEDGEFGGPYSYGPVVQQNAGFGGAFSQPGIVGQTPEVLSQVHPGIGTLGPSVGFPSTSNHGSGQSGSGQQTGPDGRIRPPGHRAACVRCKNLKVRCEFTTDPNTCRRCLNGGHECSIPGRKKRRQPPKREHLLNQIRDQANQIEKLVHQVEELRRSRLHNEPTRLSLSNTPLPAPGTTSIASQRSSSQAQGTVPRPDVQEWIERARESIKALGAFVEGEEDILEEDGDDKDHYDGDEDYSENQVGEQQWRDPGTEQDTDAEEGGVAVEGPDDGDEAHEESYREGSPAMTIRSTSRESSAPPQSGSASPHGSGRGTRRKTPQLARLAPLPETPAAPLKLIAELSIQASNRQGSRSPKNAAALAPSGYSRASSIELDPHSSTTTDSSSPKSGGAMTERGGTSGSNANEDVKAETAQESASDGEYGAMAPGYFEARKGSVPDPSRLAPARHTVPAILLRNIVTPKEVEDLFKIYFDKMNLSCSLLDPVLYTAQTTYWRSPFLFTVICAVASRYYAGRPGLYDDLITYAQLAAGTALISGPKNVETVSAYILLSLYPVPMRRWEEDRTWLYLGLAIRVATDLNLHHPSTARPRNEQHARELLNRTRVWLNCCNLDISTTSWHGKSSTIPARDYVACHSESWYESSSYNLPNFDIHLSGYNYELRLLRAFKEKIYSDPNNPTGLNKDIDFIAHSSETDETLVRKEHEWNERLQQKTDPNDPQGRFRNSLLKLAYRYARLTVLSFGFQHSFGKAGQDNSVQTSFFDRCYRAATDVVRVFIDELSTQKEYMRHGPEAQMVFVTFASAFLIKLLHPKYASYLKMEQRKEIERLIRGLIDLLSCPEVAVDDRHSPKQWSRFLDGLLATPMAKIELSPNSMKGGNPLPRRPARRPTSHASSPSGGKRGTPPVSSPRHGRDSPSAQLSETLADSPASGYGVTSSPSASVLSGSAANLSVNTAGDSNSQAQLGFMSTTHDLTQVQEQHETYGPQNSLGIDIPMFNPPLPFGNDLLQSMHSMPDPSLWQNMPGFNFMGNLHFNDQDFVMQDSLAPEMMPFDVNAGQYAGAAHY